MVRLAGRWALGTAALLPVLACGGHVLRAGGDGGSGGTDSGASEPTWDGGLLAATAPGYVRCGAATCGPEDHCCLVEQGDPATNGCDSRSSPACNGTQDVRDCARQADCHPNEVCCYQVFTTPPATLGSTCVPQGMCGGGAIGCGSDADCAEADAAPCFAQRCRGDILQTCGELPSEMCPP